MMLSYLLAIFESWRSCFAQGRTHRCVVSLAIALLCCPNRRTLTNTLVVRGQSDRTPDRECYALSRGKWEADRLSDPIFEGAVDCLPKYTNEELKVRGGNRFIPIAFDDTHLRKCGKQIFGTSWMYDPLGPPFDKPLMWGMRVLQASILISLSEQGVQASARAVPVAFRLANPAPKPPKNATDEERELYKQAQAKNKLTQRFVDLVGQLRRQANRLGLQTYTILAIGDGSFSNRISFRDPIPGVEMLCRFRINASLAKRHKDRGKRPFYGPRFTPNEVLHDTTYQFKRAKIFYGGDERTVRFKEVSEVFWHRVSLRRPLRLFVVSGTPYRRKRKGAKTNYRHPIYLITTDLTTPAEILIRHYFDRWEIEVNNRDEKTGLGFGDCQVRNEQSVKRWLTLGAAAYSALQLASIRAFGLTRKEEIYRKCPKWRKKIPKRPTLGDLLERLRREVIENPSILERKLGFKITKDTIIAAM